MSKSIQTLALSLLIAATTSGVAYAQEGAGTAPNAGPAPTENASEQQRKPIRPRKRMRQALKNKIKEHKEKKAEQTAPAQ